MSVVRAPAEMNAQAAVQAALQQAWQRAAEASVGVSGGVSGSTSTQVTQTGAEGAKSAAQSARTGSSASLYLQPTEAYDQAARLRSIMANYNAGMVMPQGGLGQGGLGQGGLGQGGVMPARASVPVAPVARVLPPEDLPVPEALPCGVPVIALTSGKGGVGKSSLAVNIASVLGSMRVRTTLVDADPGLANADVLCGVSPTTRLDSVLALGASRRSMRTLSVETPAGFRLVPGSTGLSRMAALSAHERVQLLSALTQLEETSDLLLIDTGAGLSESVLSFVRHADAALVVATPEPTSIADAYAMIKVLHGGRMRDPVCVRSAAGASPSGRHRGIFLVVNQAASDAEARAVAGRICATTQRFLGMMPEVLGCVHHDEAMRSAVRARTPVVISSPEARASTDLRELATALAGRYGLVRAATGGCGHRPRSFFARLLGRSGGN